MTVIAVIVAIVVGIVVGVVSAIMWVGKQLSDSIGRRM